MDSLDSTESTSETSPLKREEFEDEITGKLRVEEFVKTLSPRDQQIICLKMENYTDQEIATEVGYSTHSAVVKRIQHIARVYDQYVQDDYEKYLKSFE